MLSCFQNRHAALRLSPFAKRRGGTAGDSVMRCHIRCHIRCHMRCHHRMPLDTYLLGEPTESADPRMTDSHLPRGTGRFNRQKSNWFRYITFQFRTLQITYNCPGVTPSRIPNQRSTESSMRIPSLLRFSLLPAVLLLFSGAGPFGLCDAVWRRTRQ